MSEVGGTNGQGQEVPTHAEARDAALDAVEPHRLLEGEDENTAFAEDAIHWAKVYGELLDFKRSLLTLAQERAAAMDVDAEAEVEETDLKLLLAEAARFERRLDFWQDRVTDLQGTRGTNSP